MRLQDQRDNHDRGVQFFDPERFEMEINSSRLYCISVSGGDGSGNIRLSENEQKEETAVVLRSREPDHQVRELIQAIKFLQGEKL